MKKVIVLVVGLLMLIGCGNQNTLGFGNFTYNFVSCKEDYVKLRNEPISSWKDYDGEQIEVTLVSGNNLLLSSNSCLLSKEKMND